MTDALRGTSGLIPALLGLILLRWGWELALRRLNENHVRARAQAVPEPFREDLDEATYARSVRYTLAKSAFAQLEISFQAAWLAVVLLSGLLPWGYAQITAVLGVSVWSQAAAVLVLPCLVAAARLPWDWAAQFRLEERFGFNQTTTATWCADQLKALALTLLLGYPLLVLILHGVGWLGDRWWLGAWAVFVTFQVALMWLTPTFILPLFNRFTPLPDGPLRRRLLDLASRTAFRHREIVVMDGSRRSRHSNAFFTGFGRSRRIVLYDTLIAQLHEPEVEAVLAHEIGHERLGHIPRLLLAGAIGSLAGFYLVGQAVRQSTWLAELGFPEGGVGPCLLLALVFGATLTFWILPLVNWVSRRFEYQADRFAAGVLAGPATLIRALRRLSKDNLSNLTPHPLYSWFHYSHPSLGEREQALRGAVSS